MGNSLYESLLAFAGKLQDPQRAVDTLMGDADMVETANAIFAGGAYTVWVLMLGMDVAMKLSFLMGVAWQKELETLNNPKLNKFVDDIDVNLD